MRLILVRHGQAASGPDEVTRPLTAGGRWDVRRVAEALHARGVRPATIRHSGLRRAEETAEILAAALEPAGGIVADAAFAPEADLGHVAAWLAAAPDLSLCVGHLPHLERLAGLLVGPLGGEPIAFHPGTAACLARVDGAWSRLWALDPPGVKRSL